MPADAPHAFATAKIREIERCLKAIDPVPVRAEEGELQAEQIVEVFMVCQLLVKLARELSAEIAKDVVKPFLEISGEIQLGEGRKLRLEEERKEKCLDMPGAVHRIFAEGADRDPSRRTESGIQAVISSLSSNALKPGHLRESHSSCYSEFYVVEFGESKPALFAPQKKGR